MDPRFVEVLSTYANYLFQYLPKAPEVEQWTLGEFALVPAILVYFAVGVAFGNWFFTSGGGDSNSKHKGEEKEEQGSREGVKTPAPPKVTLPKVSKKSRRGYLPRIKFSCDEECKMVLVVRKDLKMNASICAEQCATAAVAVVDVVAKEAGKNKTNWRGWLQTWNDEGVKKITLSAPDEATMLALAETAKEQGLPCYMGKMTTEFSPAKGEKGKPIPVGAVTVLAIGPAADSLVNEITGELSLIS